jgi:hypothetical protein
MDGETLFDGFSRPGALAVERDKRRLGDYHKAPPEPAHWLSRAGRRRSGLTNLHGPTRPGQKPAGNGSGSNPPNIKYTMQA